MLDTWRAEDISTQDLELELGLPTSLVASGLRGTEVEKKKEIFLKCLKGRGKHENRIKLEREYNIAQD